MTIRKQHGNRYRADEKAPDQLGAGAYFDREANREDSHNWQRKTGIQAAAQDICQPGRFLGFCMQCLEAGNGAARSRGV